MNRDIRRAAIRKRREFRLNGRSPRYRRLQKEMGKLVKKAKAEWFEQVKNEAILANNMQGYYRAVKHMSTKDAPEKFDIRKMLPGKSDPEICEEVADYFIAVSNEFVPLEGPITGGVPVEPPELYRIAARLRGMKKPKSQVEGDIPPDLEFILEYTF